MATLTATQTILTSEDLQSCRIGRLTDSRFVLVSYQRSRYNPERLSIHSIMRDGIVLSRNGQRIVGFQGKVAWDDTTNFTLR